MKYHILFYSTLLYLLGISQCAVIGLQKANELLYNKIDGMHHSVMTMHELLDACENGTLKEYRIKKRKELLGE